MNQEHQQNQAEESADVLYCPVNAVMNLLNGRWTLHIIRALLDGDKRFNGLSRTEGINPRTLRERLRELEDEGVVTRTVLSAFPPHVEYGLTEKGKALNGIFEALAAWGVTWMHPKGAELLDENGRVGETESSVEKAR